MSRRVRDDLRGTLIVSAGWLFADMLLALAMLFLAANTMSFPKPLPTPTPTLTMATLTPTPLPHLSLKAQLLVLTVDPGGLLNGSQSAINDVKNQVRRQIASIKNRRAGFVLAYGGAPTVNDVKTALQVASKVESILQTFDSEGLVFRKPPETVYHDPFFLLDADSHLVKLEVYLFDT